MSLFSALPHDDDRLRLVPGEKRHVLTVTELVQLAKGVLEERVGWVWVAGEVSNCRLYPSGHTYFTLKDAGAEVSAVLFKGSAAKLPFTLENGQELVVRGQTSLYTKRGQFQLIVAEAEPKGLGALLLAFQQLKDRLEKEGLFDEARKRPIPFLPRTIGIVTSPVGAALRDMLNIIDRRCPDVRVLIAPARVQGEGAAAEIAAGIRLLNAVSEEGGGDSREDPAAPLAPGGKIDVMIVGRGGGSIEDLWPFNEEIVARAIHASKIPVISAVGHEVDVTISDLVADVHAKTPSEAAELVVPLKTEVLSRLDQGRSALHEGIVALLRDHRRTLDAFAGSAALREPHHAVQARGQRLDELASRLNGAMQRVLARRQKRFGETARRLEAQSPRAILNRRYVRLRNLNAERRLVGALWRGVQAMRRRLDALSVRPALARLPERLPRARQTLDANGRRLQVAVERLLAVHRQRYGELRGRLNALDPEAVLNRGYSITRRVKDGLILRESTPLAPGDKVETQLAKGKFTSLVDRVRE
ncbi:MAG: exodeoxyribonuclease VII large subunit [Planctomycetes bacterium]|nr:exodeoxyribonuclease VII large subunit [Planctomycetota bacterium]